MSGIELRVGRADHQKVEEFLAAGPVGVSAVSIDAKNLNIHRDVATAANSIHAAVHVEPMTDRFLDPGFNPTGISYAARYPLDLGALVSDPGDQARFVSEVIAPQVGIGTVVTPPHFYVENSDQLGLNIAMAAAATQRESFFPVPTYWSSARWPSVSTQFQRSEPTSHAGSVPAHTESTALPRTYGVTTCTPERIRSPRSRSSQAWRANGLAAQLTRARELRSQIAQYFPAGANAPQSRTIETLLSELERRGDRRRTA